MLDKDTRPPNHRSNVIKSALHILEFSNSESLVKINSAIQTLYPEDIALIEKALIQTLVTLNQKNDK